MAEWETPNFRVGDGVVGVPIPPRPAAAVWWLPDASGFDSMCRVRGPVGRFLKDSIDEVWATARGLAPVDTGNLQGSLSRDYGKWESGIWGEVYTEVEYAPFQEFGTVNHAAQPFLRPALEAAMGPYIDGTIDMDNAWDGMSGEAGQIGDFDWDANAREWISS